GKRQKVIRASEAIGLKGSQEKQTISCNLKLRKTLDGFGITDLALGDADERFFVPMIALDLPTVDVGLNESLHGQSQIGRNQKSRIAVEQFGAVAEAIANGLDHEQTKRPLGSGLAPEEVFENFDLKGAAIAGRKAGHGHEGDG